MTTASHGPMVWYSIPREAWFYLMRRFKEPIKCDDVDRAFNGFEIDLALDISEHLKPGDRVKISDGTGTNFFWDWDGEKFHTPYHPDETGPSVQGQRQ